MTDTIQGERRRVAVVEDLEADAIEPDQAFVGAEPEVAVAGLEQGGDGFGGEAIFQSPGTEGEVVEGRADLRGGREAKECPEPQEDLAGGHEALAKSSLRQG